MRGGRVAAGKRTDAMHRNVAGILLLPRHFAAASRRPAQALRCPPACASSEVSRAWSTSADIAARSLALGLARACGTSARRPSRRPGSIAIARFLVTASPYART